MNQPFESHNVPVDSDQTVSAHMAETNVSILIVSLGDGWNKGDEVPPKIVEALFASKNFLHMLLRLPEYRCRQTCLHLQNKLL